MVDWKKELRNKITTLEQLDKKIVLSEKEKNEIKTVLEKFRMSITPYYVNLIDKNNPNCPIKKMVVPSIEELTEPIFKPNLVEEKKAEPVKGVRRRYPDRALIIPSYFCPNYCRFCFRKFWVGGVEENLTQEEIDNAIRFIKNDTSLREIIITGGEPLALNEKILEYILSELRKISHIEIIRIGTRIPVVLPSRITKKLARKLSKYSPLYIITHFNHPKEITKESKKACDILADKGLPLLNQTVLLKGVNSTVDVLKELFLKLLMLRVKPYYLLHCIDTMGSHHFVTKVALGAELLRKLQGYISGLALPMYVVPTYHGKIPITHNYILKYDNGVYTFENYKGDVFEFVEPKE
ncbi:MAG: KamA family radical SAM protein [Candidatus Omnitrophica bacterium]|nr:KamA family radical SAM protein [Candidatus Omnitrophota bacterium]